MMFPEFEMSDYGKKYFDEYKMLCPSDKRRYSTFRSILKSYMCKKYGFQCQSCGKEWHTKKQARENLVVHHIQPVNKGGKDNEDNLILICHDCHQEKHGFLLSTTQLRDLTNWNIWRDT